MYNEEMGVGKTIAAAFAAMLVFVGAFLITSPAFAEERRVEVVDFDFLHGEVVLEDEDGFIWACPLGPNSWAIGEEYVLILSEEGDVNIEEVPEQGISSSLFYDIQ